MLFLSQPHGPVNMPDCIEPAGTIIDSVDLQIPKAIELARTVLNGGIEYVRFIECRRVNGNETVVFDVEAELSQTYVYPIEYVERIAVTFSPEDKEHPEVHALRADFPAVPHLNLRDYEKPRSLCLYEQRYRDIKRQWTGKRFIERIREWLKLTAKAKLHQDDQPLEPLLTGEIGTIVLPSTFRNPTSEDLPDKLYFSGRKTNKKGLFLIAHYEKPESDILPSIASVHKCKPAEHGIISRRPTNLKELSEFAEKCGVSLLNELRERLKDWYNSTDKQFSFHDHLIIVLSCPKVRSARVQPEAVDVIVFLTGKSIGDMGVEIGIYEKTGENIGLLLEYDISKTGENVALDMCNSTFHITREQAAWLNGLEGVIESKIVCIGAGALGSQVINNMAKSGSGHWTIIDDDILMPHNVVRHSLPYNAIGVEKAHGIASIGNYTLFQEDLFNSIFADVIAPRDKADEVQKALSDADIILDMTAPEVTVARVLSQDIESGAKRISLFLNPRGDDLVLLAESPTRIVRLDEVEMQYYRALLHEEHLNGHLELSEGRMRYGQSCRDVTVQLPQDLVALHAAIGSQALKAAIKSEKANIIIWRASSEGTVQRTDIPVFTTFRELIGEWEIRMDAQFIKTLFLLRKKKLSQSPPVETGGVLLGSIDMERKIIYIVDTIPAPSDSIERPLYFERGTTGLRDKVIEAGEKTLWNLEYIGEWHSHPGRGTRPSDDDKDVFSWIYGFLGQDGLPATMLIVGESSVNCIVDKITYSKEFEGRR